MVCLWCGRTVGRSAGRSVRRTYGHVITKISRMGRLPHFLTHAWCSAVRASLLTLLLPVIRSLVTSLENIQHIVQSEMVRMGTLISLRILYNTVADPGERLTLPSPSPFLFSDQTEARRAKKKFGDPHPLPPYLKVRVTSPRPPPYLKVWILHCNNAKFFYFINVQ